MIAREVISRVAGGKATVFRESWYREARLSPATPPDWVFGVTWPWRNLSGRFLDDSALHLADLCQPGKIKPKSVYSAASNSGFRFP
jgi:hypothetical protein